MITFTDKGAEKVQEFLASQGGALETSGLRVGVRGGGCSGFQYALALDSAKDDDHVFSNRGVSVLVDKVSAQFVFGGVMPWVCLPSSTAGLNSPSCTAALYSRTVCTSPSTSIVSWSASSSTCP